MDNDSWHTVRSATFDRDQRRRCDSPSMLTVDVSVPRRHHTICMKGQNDRRAPSTVCRFPKPRFRRRKIPRTGTPDPTEDSAGDPPGGARLPRATRVHPTDPPPSGCMSWPWRMFVPSCYATFLAARMVQSRSAARAGRRRTVQCRAFDDVCDDDRARLDERQPQLNNAHGSVIAVLSVTGTSGLPLMRNVEGGWRRYGRFSLAPFVRWARATGGEPSYSSSGQDGEMSVVGWSCASCCWGTFVGGGHLRSSSAVGDSSRCDGVLGRCAAVPPDSLKPAAPGRVRCIGSARRRPIRMSSGDSMRIIRVVSGRPAAWSASRAGCPAHHEIRTCRYPWFSRASTGPTGFR